MLQGYCIHPKQAVTLSADIEILQAPTDIIGIPTSENISLTWSEVEGASAYVVYRSIDNEVYQSIATVVTNSYIDVPSAAGTFYYRVQALADDNSRSELSTPSEAIEFGLYNGHEYVDLGLPSGLKWAKCNMGADYATDYGDVYAWGEVFTKSSHNSSNSKWYNKSFAELKAENAIDFKGNLTPDNDAAITNWGGGWRMPNRSDFAELINQCTWVWEIIDDVKGYTVTGPNGNSIFLPAAGSAHDSFGLHNNNGIYGYYWSNAAGNNTSGAHRLGFGSSYKAIDEWERYRGCSIRPVVEIPDRNTLTTPRDFAVEVTDGYITLSWEWVFGANHYRVYRSSDGVTFSELDNASTNSYVDNNPIEGLNYYKVQAFGQDDIHSAMTEPSDPIDYLSYNGHEYVDLGLPSGLLWAKRNIGAYDISDWGNYYSWGEVATKDSYLENDSQWYNVEYADLADRGVIDENGNLTADYDAAITNWGGGWRMPTSDEIVELYTNYSLEWVTINGHGCIKATGLSGKFIYLPAAGIANNFAIGSNSNRILYYWSSTAANDATNAKRLNSGLQAPSLTVNNSGRCWGHPVRPVVRSQ